MESVEQPKQVFSTVNDEKAYTPTSPLAHSKSRAPRTFSKKIAVALTNAELEKAKQLAYDRQPLDELADSSFDELLDALAEDRKQYSIDSNFKMGNKVLAAIDYVHEYRVRKQKKELKAEAEHQYEVQVEEFNQQLTNFDLETKRMQDELLAKQKMTRERILGHHQDELDEHNEYWNSDAKARLYNRASPHLIILRKTLRNLLAQCRFTEAEQMQLEVNKIEREEEEKNASLMRKNYEDSLNRLLKKHNEEMGFFEQNNSIQLQQLMQRRVREKMRFSNMQKKLEAKKEDTCDIEKLWNKTQAQRKEEMSARANKQVGTTKSVDIHAPICATIKLPPLSAPRSARLLTGRRNKPSK